MKLDPGGEIDSGCDAIRKTDNVATSIESRVTDTAAEVAATAAVLEDSTFTPVAIQSRLSEPCFGLLPPQEVSGRGSTHPVVFIDDSNLGWERAAANGACAFNLYRGSIEQLLAGSYGVCFAGGLVASTANDAESPPPGKGFAYLVTGRNGAGEGGAGTDSSGNPRVVSASCP
jgi:hypothetical protein